MRSMNCRKDITIKRYNKITKKYKIAVFFFSEHWKEINKLTKEEKITI